MSGETWTRKSLVAYSLVVLVFGSLIGAGVISAATSPQASPSALSAPSIYADNYYVGTTDVTDRLTADPSISYTYIIGNDAGTIYAKSGVTGQIIYSGTDASTVIQNTIDDLTSGQCVYIKEGVYQITTTITLGQTVPYIYRVGIVADGATFQLQSGGDTTAIKVGDFASASAFRYMFIKGLRIDCNNIAGTTGIRLEKVYSGSFENILIENVRGIGIDLQGPAYNNLFKDVTVYGWNNAATTLVGFAINQNMDSGGVRICTFQHIVCRYTYQSLVLYDYCNTNLFLNPDIESNYLYNGIVLGEKVGGATQIYENTFITPYIEGGSNVNRTGVLFGSSGAGTGVNHNLIMEMHNSLPVANRVQDNSGKSNNYIIYSNLYYVTEKSGSSSIPSGSTSKVVNHGCSYTPDANDITITFTANPTNDPGNIWVSAIGATNFTLNCRNDPGASGLAFSWVVRRTP